MIKSTAVSLKNAKCMLVLIFLLSFIMTLPTNANTLAAPRLPVDVTYAEAFPDNVFREYVLKEIIKNGRGDSDIVSVLDQEVMAKIDLLFICNMDIYDLSGLEYFVNLWYLDASVDKLTSLDVSKNTALEYIFVSNNQLSFLDVSNNPNLQILDVLDNQLEGLDVTNNKDLETLFVTENNMISPSDVIGWQENGLIIDKELSFLFYPQRGVTVSGRISSYNPQRETKIALYRAGSEHLVNDLAAKTTIEAKEAGSGQITQDFTLEYVPAGVYDLVVSKQTHVNYTITGVIVGKIDMDLSTHPDSNINMITLPCGDINEDGFINSSDLSIIIMPSNYGKQITEAGVNPLADLIGSGWVNSSTLSVIILPANYDKTHIKYAYN